MGMAFHEKSASAGQHRAERGYVLLSLMLIVALLAIAVAAVAPSIAFQIKRDREEEMVHRGVQYSRAIRGFLKANRRYPNRLEELSDTGGLRFIRKFYKDPMTGRDFKLLHMTDLPSQGGIANLNPSDSQAGGNEGAAPSDAANVSGTDASGRASDSDVANSTGALSQPGTANATGASASTPSTGFKFTPSPDLPPGLLIFGVASRSKAKSIREFNHKNHYNDWLFFYDPRYDRGYEIKGPTVTTPGAALQTPPPASQSPSAPQP
jgi:type II secretory pathway pseudopilin PulG